MRLVDSTQVVERHGHPSGIERSGQGGGKAEMNVVVTGGGTIAPIDDVRHIANASSGRFSAAITEAFLAQGHSVWHIHTPSAVLPFERQARFDLETRDEGAEFERLRELRQLYLAGKPRLHLMPVGSGVAVEYADLLKQVLLDRSIDIAVLAMAVSDYEPIRVPGKLDSAAEELHIRCRPTPKVIRSVRDWAPEVYLAGFKLMSGASDSQLIEKAHVANRINRSDVTVANDLEAVRAGRHTIHLVRADQGVETLGPDPRLSEKLAERLAAYAAAR
jgi:phosphopantothenate-cysteine ligase